MNADSTAEVSQTKFATAVQNFAPKPSAKLRMLLPFKAGIEELRRKRASYDTIVEILHGANVVVSRHTLTRFCYEVAKLPPRLSRRKKARIRAVEQKPRRRPRANSVVHHDTERKSGAGGPRVADPNNI